MFFARGFGNSVCGVVLWGLVGSVVWGLAAPPVARARAPGPGAVKTDQKKARELFRRAEVKYTLGQFKSALALYSAAYQHLQLPGFLFNIGQCHRNLHNYRKALFFYGGYLRKAMQPANRELVLRVIGVTERLLAEKIAARRARARRVVVRPRLPDPLPVPGRDLMVPKVRPRGGLHRRWWFWTALAAGAATVVGLSVGLATMRRSDDGPPQGSLGTIDVRY